METAPMLYHAAKLSADRNADVDAFFDTLRKEQTRFLDTIGHARSLLVSKSGELAKITAVQVSLTRQFLDAQRSIMKRRAEADAEVALILEQAGEMSYVIVGAFDTDETSSAAAQRVLATLLDDWWSVENQNCRAMVDAARARVTARQEPAAIDIDMLEQFCDVAEPSERVTEQAQGASRLPAQIVAELDAADPVDLLSVLTNLAELFEPPPTERPPRQRPVIHEPATDDLVIRLDAAPIGFRRAEIATDSTFQEFWEDTPTRANEDGSPSRRTSLRNALRSVATRVVLPMTIVTSAIVGLMVWIG